MKAIKTSEESIICGQTKTGRPTFKIVKKSVEVSISEILSFTVKSNGVRCETIDDKMELFEEFFRTLILKHPEDFRDYLEVCAEDKSSLYTNYKIED